MVLKKEWGVSMLGDINRSNLIVIIFLFFGSISVAFTSIGQSQYAIASLVIAAIIHFFNDTFVSRQEIQDQEVAFGLELNNLAKMVVYGLAPATLLIRVTNGDFISVVVASIFLLSVAIRLAHYNRPIEWQGHEAQAGVKGLPLVAIVMLLPLLSLFSWILEAYMAIFLWNIVYLIVLFAYVIRIDVPSIPANYKFAVLALGLLSIIALLIQGNLILQ